MEVVSSDYMIRKFRTIKEFQIDLGSSIMSEAKKEGDKGPGQLVIKIKDPFVKRYSLEYETYISKMGHIGTLSFYVDNQYKPMQFKIFDEDKTYEFVYNDENQLDIRSYLSRTLNSIFDNEVNPIQLDRNMEENIVFQIDKNLPAGEFLKQYNEMKRRMDEMGVNLKKN